MCNYVPFFQIRSHSIAECDPDKGIDRDDALFCEGDCQAWVHRMCVGLNKQTYKELSEEDSPHCNISQQTKVIEDLKINTQLNETLKSRLLTSFQEVTISSITSLKTTIESEVKSLHTKVSDLTKHVQKLENAQLEPNSNATNSNSVNSIKAQTQLKFHPFQRSPLQLCPF